MADTLTERIQGLIQESSPVKLPSKKEQIEQGRQNAIKGIKKAKEDLEKLKPINYQKYREDLLNYAAENDTNEVAAQDLGMPKEIKVKPETLYRIFEGKPDAEKINGYVSSTGYNDRNLKRALQHDVTVLRILVPGIPEEPVLAVLKDKGGEWTTVLEPTNLPIFVKAVGIEFDNFISKTSDP